MQATLDPQTRFTKTINSSMEETYLREGFMTIDGKQVPLFVAHKETRCEDCEWPLTNTRRHPLVAGTKDVHMVCGGHMVHVIA